MRGNVSEIEVNAKLKHFFYEYAFFQIVSDSCADSYFTNTLSIPLTHVPHPEEKQATVSLAFACAQTTVVFRVGDFALSGAETTHTCRNLVKLQSRGGKSTDVMDHKHSIPCDGA